MVDFSKACGGWMQKWSPYIHGYPENYRPFSMVRQIPSKVRMYKWQPNQVRMTLWFSPRIAFTFHDVDIATCCAPIFHIDKNSYFTCAQLTTNLFADFVR